MSESTRPSRIPVIFCVDVEPDEFFVDRRNPESWAGFEFSHEYLNGYRQGFQQKTGMPVHFTWLLRMDPQVADAYGSATWAAEKYADRFEQLRVQGDEIGLHVHTYRWSNAGDKWLDDCGNPAWVAECLESSFDAFKRAFGATPRVLRFGNFWLSTEAVNLADRLGFEYDLTVEPGLDSILHTGDKPPQTGPTPDYYRVPRSPYIPDRSDFRKRSRNGDGGILMIPLTSAYIDHGWGTRELRIRLGRLRRNGIRGRLQSRPLSMWRKWNGENGYAELLSRAVKVQQRPYLAFAIRSDMNGKDFPAYDSSLRALHQHAIAPRLFFATPSEAMADWLSV